MEFLSRSSSGDAPLVAFGSSDGVIRVLSMLTWKVKHTLPYPLFFITGLLQIELSSLILAACAKVYRWTQRSNSLLNDIHVCSWWGNFSHNYVLSLTLFASLGGYKYAVSVVCMRGEFLFAFLLFLHLLVLNSFVIHFSGCYYCIFPLTIIIFCSGTFSFWWQWRPVDIMECWSYTWLAWACTQD